LLGSLASEREAMLRSGMIGVALIFLIGAVPAVQADTLKHKETGEVIKGRFQKGRINNKRIFKNGAGETKFLDMDNWIVVEAQGQSGRQEPGAPEAPPGRQRTSEATPTPGGLMTQDEVLTELFKRYRSLRDQHEAYLEQRKAAKARVSDVTKSLAEITGKYRRNKQAVERVLNAAKAAKTAAARVLAMPPPRRPRLQPLPSRPNPALYESTFAYEVALDNWARECSQIKQNNELLIREYEASLRQHEVRRNQAGRNLQTANAKIAECKEALAALLKKRQNAERPLKTKRHELTEGTRDADAEARKLVRKLKATAEAIRGISETIRLEHGVVEWKNKFYSLTEIEQMYSALSKEIKADRDAVEFQIGPEDIGNHSTGHHKQEETDALKGLIEKAKAAQAGSVPG